MAKEVAKRETTEMMTADMFSGFATGFEGTSMETFKTPFLKVLQAMSPELKKNDPKYVPGAQMGQFINTATNECSDSLEVVILKVDHCLVVWHPSRGGLVGRFPKSKEDELVRKSDGLKKWTADGDEVIDTIEFYCMDINNPANIFVFPLSTTSLKHGKSFATRLRALQVDGKSVRVSWAGVWEISTTEESNDKGSWYTLGGTPMFKRLITKEEMDEHVLPAIEMLKKAETDYSIIESKASEDESVEY